MGSTALAMHSYVAECINTEFGTHVMEVVAAQFLVERLINEFEQQSGGGAPSPRACVIEAFQALEQTRSIDPITSKSARCSFEVMPSALYPRPNHLGGFKV